MHNYQREFIHFAVEHQVLRFGNFRTKSGRDSPYFYDSGGFSHGVGISRLGEFYAAALHGSGIRPDMLYGPAYKGIPLVVSLSMAWHRLTGVSLPWCFNRKEEKPHGEKGRLVGASPAGNVLIVDDVITSGLSTDEACAILRTTGATPCAVMVAVDREEIGQNGESAIAEVEQRHSIQALSIIRLGDIMEYLQDDPILKANREALTRYRSRYCVAH